MLKYFVFFILSLLSLTLQAENLESAIMPGKLIHGHTKYEDDCANCHKRFDKEGQDKLCMDCHKEVGKDVASKQGFHGRLDPNKKCHDCHTDHKGANAKVVDLDEKAFKHKDTDFLLKGKHADEKVKCEDCHKAKKKWREAPHECIDCHKKDDDKIHKGELGKDCTKCHSENHWSVEDFDHSKTSYDLKGSHRDVKCKACHVNNKYKDLGTKCFDCHKKDDDKAHKNVFGNKCEKCHTESDWKDKLLFNHDRDTKFKLLDKHHETSCQSCHKLPGQKLESTCISCHKKDDKHNGTLGPKCESCHGALNWKTPKGFDHNKTRFVLRDAHFKAKCSTCHTAGLQYEKLPLDCWSCHKKDDEKAHKGNYGQKCESCHKEDKWKKIYFNHDLDTKYRLLYKHKDVKCDDCHKGKLYEQKLSSNCYDCHKKTDDKEGHKGSLGKACGDCHNEKGWKVEVKFDHNKTKFPLLGSHFKVECKKCHDTAKYNDAKKDCYSCHQKEDKHELKLGTACEKCHNVRDWKAWDFDHGKTKFKLDGGHGKLDCLDCHTIAMKKDKIDTPMGCAGCHNKDDVHEGGFGKQCDKCHTTKSFKEIIKKTGT